MPSNRRAENAAARVANRKRVKAARAKAEEVFESADAAKDWLETECPTLGFVRPVDLLGDDDGLRQVMTILLRIEYGIFS